MTHHNRKCLRVCRYYNIDEDKNAEFIAKSFKQISKRTLYKILTKLGYEV